MKKINSLTLGFLFIISFGVSAQTSSSDSTKKSECDEIFTYVEEMPQFPGGEGEMYKFIEENIKYPKMAQDSGIQGAVYVRFIISDIGLISHVEILRGMDGGCSEEAKRVVKAMPLWKSGKQNGTPVCVYYTLPIRFTLK